MHMHKLCADAIRIGNTLNARENAGTQFIGYTVKTGPTVCGW